MSAPVMASRTVEDLEPGIADRRELDESSDLSMQIKLDSFMLTWRGTCAPPQAIPL